MVGNVGYGLYDSYGYNNYGNIAPSSTILNTNQVAGNVYDSSRVDETSVSDAKLRQLKRSGAVECEACKTRKYQDGSNESDVSFKAPGHISASKSAATVMSHEQEHVQNAYEKAAKGNGKVVSATVSLKTAICPECGRSYVAGGVTNTMIKYNESNPYGKAAKSIDQASLLGNKADYSV